MSSQGPAYGRLRRALDAGNVAVALAAATELDFVSLSDAPRDRLLLQTGIDPVGELSGEVARTLSGPSP